MPSQSEILGFDTRQFSNQTTTGRTFDPLGAITDGLGNVVNSVGNIFDRGLEIYSSVRDRVKAAQMIRNETVTSSPSVVEQPSNNFLTNNGKAVIIGSIALLGAGILIARVAK